MSLLSRQEMLGASLRTGAGQQEYEPLDWLLRSALRAVSPAKSRWCCWALGAPCAALASCTPLTLCLTDSMQVPGTSSFHLMQSQQTSYRKSRRNQVLNHPRSGCSPACSLPGVRGSLSFKFIIKPKPPDLTLYGILGFQGRTERSNCEAQTMACTSRRQPSSASRP